jgi:hypothetical protein
VGRIRTVKPEFFKHSGLYDAEVEFQLPLRLAFAGLWTCCDREGRFKWRPRELKLDVLPYDECDFSRVLDALSTRGFVVKYASGNEEFGYIPTFGEHQFINNKEAPSHIPKPPKSDGLDASLTRGDRVSDAKSTRGVKEGKGKEGKDEACDLLDITPEMVASRVLDECRVAGMKLRMVLEEVARAEQKAGTNLDTLTQKIVGSIKLYESERQSGSLAITWGLEKFIGDRHYIDPSMWPRKPGFEKVASPMEKMFRNQSRRPQ